MFEAGLTTGKSAGSGFTGGQTYYFQARSFNTLDIANPHPTGWCNYLTGSTNNCGGTSGNFTGVKIAAPTCSGTCTSVTGSVTIPAGITIKSGATLYMGLVEFSSSGTNGGPIGIYVTQYTGTLSNGSANDFTVNVPSGSNYGIVTFLDQNNVGQINGSGVIGDANDTITDTLTISGGSQNVGNFNLPTAGSYAVVGTQYSSNTCQGCSPATTTSYSLNFDVEGLDKLPVAVTLAGASNLNVLNNAGTVALDMSICNDCGNAQFEYSITLLGGTPNVGDTYTFDVTYSDSTVSSPDTGTVTGTVTGWNGGSTVVGASDLPTNLSPGPTSNSSNTEPTFTWTWPTAAITASDDYQFYLSPESGCSGNCDIWDIPGNNSNSNGFTYAQDQGSPYGGTTTTGSLTWGNDPSGSGSSPTGPLTPTDTYNWQISVRDGNKNAANHAQASTYFTVQ